MQHVRVSWDLFVMRLPKGITSLEEIPKDFVPESLGRRDDLVATIKTVVPGANFSDRLGD
jgi:hypothetical protein